MDDAKLLTLLPKLEKAASVQKSFKKDEIITLVTQISDFASAAGLPENALDAIIDVVTQPSYLDNTRISILVKSLIPRVKISNATTCKVIGSFGEGASKPSYYSQEHLMKWLVMGYRFLENYETVSRLYTIIFNCLYMIHLRPYACHLLVFSTKRKHVTPFRIQALMELERKVGAEPALLGLLRVYKNFYPDVIVGNIPATRANLFKTPDAEWMENLMRIQDATATTLSSASQTKTSKLDKAKSLYFPKLQTFEATENSSTIEEVDQVGTFVQKLDKLQLPSQLGAVFVNDYLQQYLVLTPNEQATERIENFVEGLLYDEQHFATNGRSSKRLQGILEVFYQYTEKSCALLVSLDDFLVNYLKTWDGMSCREEVLKLLSYVPLRSLEDLHEDYFKHIDNALSNGDVNSQTRLVDYYADLTRNWIMRYSCSVPIDKDESTEQNLRANLDHMNSTCVSLFEKSGGSLAVLSSILSLYESICSMPTAISPFKIFLPADSLVYGATFSGSAMPLSRICGILMKYKTTFMRYSELQKMQGSMLDESPRAHVDHFNGFLMDICNAIWRNRAFKHTADNDRNALGCNIPDELVEELKTSVQAGGSDISSLFSLSHSYILGLISITHHRLMESTGQIPPATQGGEGTAHRHPGGPVTLATIKRLANMNGFDVGKIPGGKKAYDDVVKNRYKDYKVGVIGEMDRRGLVGLNELMNNTMVRK